MPVGKVSSTCSFGSIVSWNEYCARKSLPDRKSYRASRSHFTSFVSSLALLVCLLIISIAQAHAWYKKSLFWPDKNYQNVIFIQSASVTMGKLTSKP